MPASYLMIETLPTDPELEMGGDITLERADGRTVWRQRLRVVDKLVSHRGTVRYHLAPVVLT